MPGIADVLHSLNGLKNGRVDGIYIRNQRNLKTTTCFLKNPKISKEFLLKKKKWRRTLGEEKGRENRGGALEGVPPREPQLAQGAEAALLPLATQVGSAGSGAELPTAP